MPWPLLRPEPQMLVKALIDSGANVNALGRHKKPRCNTNRAKEYDRNSTTPGCGRERITERDGKGGRTYLPINRRQSLIYPSNIAGR